MKPRVLDARHLDVKALAKAGASLSGDWPGSGFERLLPSLAAGAATSNVEWNVRGWEEPVHGAAAKTWLELEARAPLQLVCQRCLQACETEVSVHRRFLFVADETTAASLDEELEDEVLVISRDLDVHELLEDELLLDLPLVPRHEVCPEPLLGAPGAAADAVSEEAANPFAVLAGFKAARAGD